MKVMILKVSLLILSVCGLLACKKERPKAGRENVNSETQKVPANILHTQGNRVVDKNGK